jgi:cation diffusion facilitator CzcD-associated flavoprotein CzcO
MSEQTAETESTENYDVIVIGAGVSGMYALHHLREMGLSAEPGGTTAIPEPESMVPAVPSTATHFPKIS